LNNDAPDLMRLTLDALMVLDAIDRKGSFAAAAEALHRVPSAVTYAVQKLEEDLDVLLFDRSGHRAQLTDAGRELLREGRYLLNATAELEERVKRVATGYEVELRVAVNDLIPIDRLFPLVDAFYRECHGTRLKLMVEVFGGLWDALIADRADFVIGAPGDGPPGGGYTTRLMGSTQFLFMVAPNHPLAAVAEPLKPEDILPYRAVAAADSSRNLPPRTAGLLTGQDVLTVPDMEKKVAAQVAGLGVGFLPVHLARAHLGAGRLVRKLVAEERAPTPLFNAWRTSHRGKALAWLLKRFDEPALGESLLA
jgi:DNA-binding transcriptional LysR family regulator